MPATEAIFFLILHNAFKEEIQAPNRDELVDCVKVIRTSRFRSTHFRSLPHSLTKQFYPHGHKLLLVDRPVSVKIKIVDQGACL